MSITSIVKAIRAGEVIIIPTDTVYGLVCDASNEKAVEKIFRIKNRDKNNPLPIFVKDIGMAKSFAYVSNEQEKVIEKSWPGAVTFVLKAKPGLSPVVYKNDTIALRAPNYDLIQQILKEFKKPLAQTSANISGQPASTKVKEVLKNFSEKDVLIIDEGDLPDNRPSTIIDLTSNSINILRK